MLRESTNKLSQSSVLSFKSNRLNSMEAEYGTELTRLLALCSMLNDLSIPPLASIIDH
jgi:hypothetical protein